MMGQNSKMQGWQLYAVKRIKSALSGFLFAKLQSCTVGLETDSLWPRSYSWLFRAGVGLGLEPPWYRSRSLKFVSRPGDFFK